ncbi:O-antigen polymerase [Paenibacillus sp. MMS20-IR301]|uniref:O-antigen polymerase n=1 Tax=Paenibacillus sp. MMS20-IR301 TaxID=2895946 RepID=UPI0028E6CF76|nr:O-antigen polymerase [Paenibacillus sp. MMS20-IR301]WNS43531.1 O-antigen polymerase [Paenibacillus sp. MMS20-IR301]
MYLLTLIFFLSASIFLVKFTAKNWMNPGNVMMSFWAFFLIASLLFLHKYEWDYLGLFWIISLCLIFNFGIHFGISYSKRGLTSTKQASCKHEFLRSGSWNVIIIFIIIGLLKSIIEVSLYGFNLSMIFDLNNLVDINTEIAYRRYNGASYSNVILQIMNIFVYSAPLCGGYVLIYSKSSKEKIIALCSLVPVILNLMITNTKAGLIASVFLWVSGCFVGYLNARRTFMKFKKRQVILGVVSVFLLLAVLYSSMLFRIGDFSSNTMNIVNDKFLVYALGHVPSFDLWLSQYYTNDNYYLGKYTFLGVIDAFGWGTRDQGVYTFLQGSLSNVFTAFRGLIEDFGIIGAMVFIAILGFISGISFNSVVSGRNNKISITLLASIYFFIFYSFIISPWTYNSYILVFFVFYVFLFLSSKKRELRCD